MKLTPHDIAQPLWSKLVEWYTPTLAKHRARLENPRIEESERIELCWKIAAIKDLFSLAEPVKKAESDAE